MMSTDFQILHLGLFFCLFSLACSHVSNGPPQSESGSNFDHRQSGVGASQLSAARDWHSYSNPEQVRVQHLDLECEVLFEQKILRGVVVLSVEKVSSDNPPPLVLDKNFF
jgi:hypothetical protein